jgi:cob(I)alamin adenosyltransferase
MRSGNPPGSSKVLPVMVKINRVYTRTGDDGRTVLGDGARLPKFHIRVAATGSVDEANAFIGWAARHVSETARAILLRVQNDLFDIGADLCRPERSGLKVELLRLQEAQVAWLEERIDEHNAMLAPLTSFVLPGGSEGSALLHIARTIARLIDRLYMRMTTVAHWLLAMGRAANQSAASPQGKDADTGRVTLG